MTAQQFLHKVDGFSTQVGKAFAWLIVALMLLVVVEVFKRYFFNSPSSWVYDASNMLYGTLFMMGGAYALCQDAHVRGDFLYGSFPPKRQATLDLILYVLFFLPGVLALTVAGFIYAGEAWKIKEQTFSAYPLPLYPFKAIIPLAGVVVLMQGIAEIVRCVVCLKTGAWTPRLKDAQEADVVEQQLAASEHVDEATKKLAIEKAANLENDAALERAHQVAGHKGGDQGANKGVGA